MPCCKTGVHRTGARLTNNSAPTSHTTFKCRKTIPTLKPNYTLDGQTNHTKTTQEAREAGSAVTLTPGAGRELGDGGSLELFVVEQFVILVGLAQSMAAFGKRGEPDTNVYGIYFTSKPCDNRTHVTFF